MHKLLHELLKDLRLKTLKREKSLTKFLKYLELKATSKPVKQNKNFTTVALKNSKTSGPENWNTSFFYKHNAYKDIQPGINEKNKYMLSILASLENSCFLFFCLKSHLGWYSEPCQTSKMKLFPKIVNGYNVLNILTKNLHLRVHLCDF